MSEKEEIKLAKTAGFCWGVKRAIDLTLETANSTNGPVYTHGPLIHNPQVIEMLEGKEVYAIKEASDLDCGKVIIRTHGIAPEVRRDIKSRDLSITDATCPLVAKVQGIIKKYANRGYTTIIIGDKGHAEVVGLIGYTKERYHVVQTIEDVEALPPMDNISVVAQTTCDTFKYKDVVKVIKARYPDAIINNTICEATEERQGEVLKLAEQVDAMVVVGGKNSSNTRRLATLAEEAGAAVFHIETEEELNPHEMARFERIGLTAGASTPTWMIQRVHTRLKELGGKSAPSFAGTVRRIVEAFVLSNLSVAIGAGFMVLANSILMGVDISFSAVYIAGAYLFSMHVLNRLNDVKTFKHNEPEKIRFYLRHRSLMTAAALIAAGVALGLALSIGIAVALVLVGAVIVGLMYTVKWFPKSEFIRIHRLKDIPASKDIFVGVAWAVITALVPALAMDAEILSTPVAVAFIFTFSLVYIRSVLSDIRDIHGDRLVGRETIPILIGNEATKKFLAGLTLGLAITLMTASSAGLVGPFGYVLLLSIVYTACYLFLYSRRFISTGLSFDLAVDGVFHFTGLLALAWVLVA